MLGVTLFFAGLELSLAIRDQIPEAQSLRPHRNRRHRLPCRPPAVLWAEAKVDQNLIQPVITVLSFRRPLAKKPTKNHPSLLPGITR
jgi:hypothetical protein